MAGDINDTLRERQATHGDFSEFAGVCQRLKDVMHSHTIWPHSLSPMQREALDMIVHKIARIMCGNPNERDHWHDIAGYATLVERSIPVPPAPAARDTSDRERCPSCGVDDAHRLSNDGKCYLCRKPL